MKKPFFFALAILGLAIVLAVDYKTITGKKRLNFVFDDLPVIFYNSQLQSPDLVEAMSWNPFRSTVYFTYWLQISKQFRGNLAPEAAASFRLVNIILHWLAGLALVWAGGRLWPERKNLPALAALWFWINPVFMEAENMVLGRTEIMLTLFYLLALGFYLGRKRPGLNRAGFFIALLLALFCKEVAVTIPVAVLLLSLYRSEKPKWVEVTGGAVIVAAFIILRLSWTIQLAQTPEAVPPWPTYFLNQNWIFWFAGLKTLIPFHLTFDYLPHSSLALGLIFLAANTGLLGLLVFKSGRGWKSGWLLLIYPLLYLPLAVIPLADALRESRLYLTGAWLILICSFGFDPAFMSRKYLSRGLAVVAFACLGLLALFRAGIWTSEGRLWHDALVKSPDKFRPAYNYASALRHRLDLERAGHFYLWAKAIAPENPKVDWALGLIEEAKKHPEEIDRVRRQLEENSETR